MIKHRFIVGPEDFRIFAAIPTESRLLHWKRWRCAPDWPALRALTDEAIGVFLRLEEHWGSIADGYETISRAETPKPLNEASMLDKEKETRRLRGAQGAEARIVQGTCRQTVRDLHAHRHLFDGDRPSSAASPFHKNIEAFVHLLQPSAGGNVVVDMEVMISSMSRHLDYYADLAIQETRDVRALEARARGEKLVPTTERTKLIVDGEFTLEEAKQILDGSKTMHDAYNVLIAIMELVIKRREDIHDLIGRAESLLSSEPNPTVSCPPGIPFAAYTVELLTGGNPTVVNIVEGMAWINEREPTDDERRVVEIISQMLTERGLNPKADTRVITRELDPSHAAKQHDAERRPGPPKMRTIKFAVTPPRYLREAAEEILASPRRAHWVIGHWRNQPFGEKHLQRRQTWISPHIRGLGEASATASRVVAPTREPS